MAMMAFERDIDTHAEAFGSTLTPRNRITDATKEAPTIARLVALDRGDVLRIKNGRGTRVRATDGVLWITEENSPDDHVLLPGGSLELAQTGLAVVLAHRAARVVVEVPAGVTPPRAVDLTLGRGQRGMRIALGEPTPVSLSLIAAAIGTFIGKVLASIDA